MSDRLEGGCHCGAIRYVAEGPQLFGIHCCCRRCQHITGTGHASSLGLSAEGFALTGTPTTHQSQAESGNMVTSGFCGTCGSPIFSTSSGHPDLVFLHAGSLDDPDLYRPGRIIYQSTRRSWDFAEPGSGDA